MKKNQPINPILCAAEVGSEQWWKSIQALGTPLTIPIDANNDLVSFIWQNSNEQHFHRQHTKIETVYIDLYSRTPHPTQQLTPFTQLDNTDVWYWETELPNDWLGSYFLMPATNKQPPPVNPTHQSIRQWWIELMSLNAQADPLNKRPPHSNGNGVPLSAVRLRNAYCTDQFTTQNKPNNSLEKHQWISQKLNNERSIWLYTTGNHTTEKRPVVLFFDGQYWAKNMPFYDELDALTMSNKLPPAVYVFIDSINSTFRHKELSCNTNFLEAIQEELLPWINTQSPVTENPFETILVGQSLGGLCALFGTLHWPSHFASAISQSGSFWWPDIHSELGESRFIKEAIRLKTPPSNVVIEAGCYEKDMLKVSQIMANTLKKNGHNVTYNEFKGGHDWLCWRQGLLANLMTIFNHPKTQKMHKSN